MGRCKDSLSHLGRSSVSWLLFRLRQLSGQGYIPYDAAEWYIKTNLNGRDKIPLPAWKAEREKLTAEKNRLNREYTLLKTDIATVEKIRSNVYDIMREESRGLQRTRARGMEL